MFFETAFGICIGCKLYNWIYKEKAQYCPGEICDVKAKQDIQKTSINQYIIIIAFFLFILFIYFTLNNYFKLVPTDLFKLMSK